MLAEAQRTAMLQTMGIEVYRLRVTPAEPSPTQGAADAGLIVICAPATLPMHLRMQMQRALGAGEQRLHWCDCSGAGLPPNAAAYVAIGTEAARALGVQLSTMQQHRSIIATTMEPSELLRDARARRALWHVLKPVARRLRELA